MPYTAGTSSVGHPLCVTIDRFFKRSNCYKKVQLGIVERRRHFQVQIGSVEHRKCVGLGTYFTFFEKNSAVGAMVQGAVELTLNVAESFTIKNNFHRRILISSNVPSIMKNIVKSKINKKII